jgi:RsiW-degrading membrane proteinase PrsW (M82 family)
MWIVFAVLFVAYAALKLFAVPEAARALDPGYLRSTAIVTVMTGLVPFLVGVGATRQLTRSGAAVLIPMTAVVLTCVLMYAAFWYFFIPNDPAIRPPLWTVARRGFLPGLVMGAVLLLHPRR